MSVLRLLSSNRVPIAGPSSISNPSNRVPTLTLQVPAYGALFLDAPDEHLNDGDREGSSHDPILQGHLEVYVPPSMGRRRCKALRVYLKTTVKLDIGPGRMGEEDVLFERKVELVSDTSEGFWLDADQQWFDFTIIIPSTLAPHDWHPNGRTRHTLIAEMEGLESNTAPSSFFSFRSLSTGHRSPRVSGSPANTRPSSPGPEGRGHISAVLPQVPSYDTLRDEWIPGNYRTERNIMLCYNPSSGGGTSKLDERGNGYAENVGVWDMRITSDPWSIGGFIQANFNMTSVSATASIYCVKVSLSQMTSIKSPRDAKDAEPVVSVQDFPIAQQGNRPPKADLASVRDWPALWSGKEAGGKDTGDLKVEVVGRMPNDLKARPSTLPGVNTPITVSHKFMLEVYFSSKGAKGQPLQMLKIKRPVVVPSCLFVPQVVELPSYDSYETDKFQNTKVNQPCPMCHIRPSDNYCRKCPPVTAPHLRHDHDPKLVGRPDGRCPLCRRGLMPSGDPGWHYCACGMGVNDMMERLKSVQLEDSAQAQRSQQDRTRDKEEAERGRTRHWQQNI